MMVCCSGTSVSATIEGLGVEYVYSGGTDSGATLSHGGGQVIRGGIASAVQVLSLGYQYISGDDTGAAGLAVSTTISSGGEVIVDSGGVASAMTIGRFG